MATLPNPALAYRRVQRDAAIMGADPRALTLLCYDEFLDALGAALHADARGSAARCRSALDRAFAALSAIRAGTDSGHPVAELLESMFGAAEGGLRAAMIRFNRQSLQTIRDDFADIRAALANS